jgi:hypothetical protein
MLRRPTPVAPLLAIAIFASACGDAAISAPPESAARFASGGDGGVESNETFPIEFRLSAGRCGLTTDIVATGEFHAIVRTTKGSNGQVLEVGYNDSAHGTAVGADGSEYVFNYHHNRHRLQYDGTRPFEARFTDHFHLIGKGGAPDIHTFFNQYFRVELNGSRTILREVTFGDPARCDPI